MDPSNSQIQERGHSHLDGGDLRSSFHRLRRLLDQWGSRRILAVIAGLYLLSGLYFVSADQQALELILGKVLNRKVRSLPGIHWTWPYPIARVEKLKVRETKRLTVGIEAPDQVLGRGVGEVKAQFLTGDQNITNLRLAVQYTIEDPFQYLFAAKDVTSVIAKTVEAALSSVVVRHNVDDLLTTEKVAVQQQVQRVSQSLLDSYESGVSITNVSIESIAPPDEVLEAFRDVASAREDKDRIVRQAESYANDVMPRARGEATRLMEEASSYRQRKINEAQGDAARFISLAAEYAKAREVTSTRLFLETMEEVLPRLKKIIVESGPGGVDLDLIQKK